MNEIASTLLKLNFPCHNQAVERHVEVVTEVSAQVVGFEKKNCLVRQKLVTKIDENILRNAAICSVGIFIVLLQKKFNKPYHFQCCEFYFIHKNCAF